jgi:predicted MFS family arabinose efflux permease
MMQVMVVPLMVSMAFVREPVTFTALYSLRFVFMNITNPILSSVTFSYLPSNKLSTISGINGLLNNVARAIAAMMFGYVVGAETQGYTSIFLISASFYAIGAVIAFLIFKEFENKETTKSLY